MKWNIVIIAIGSHKETWDTDVLNINIPKIT